MMLSPGSLVDVAGLSVGHAAVGGRATGCTVVLCPTGATAGAAVRGGAPGTRETDLLRPENTVQQVHAILLTGGSAFGLDAAGGVMRWLEERGHGLPVGPARVPIVPAAVLFDLWIGDWRIRPTAETGYAACEAAAATPPAQGNAGAGLGATVGKRFGIGHAMKGGIGSASLRVGAHTVAALVAVNAIGDVIDERGQVLAGARGQGAPLQPLQPGTATTIGVIATDARLDKAQCTQLANQGHHGLARAVNPITVHDGDTFFALATGGSADAVDASALGIAAAEVVARAIRNAVRAATALTDPPLPAAR